MVKNYRFYRVNGKLIRLPLIPYKLKMTGDLFQRRKNRSDSKKDAPSTFTSDAFGLHESSAGTDTPSTEELEEDSDPDAEVPLSLYVRAAQCLLAPVHRLQQEEYARRVQQDLDAGLQPLEYERAWLHGRRSDEHVDHQFRFPPVYRRTASSKAKTNSTKDDIDVITLSSDSEDELPPRNVARSSNKAKTKSTKDDIDVITLSSDSEDESPRIVARTSHDMPSSTTSSMTKPEPWRFIPLDLDPVRPVEPGNVEEMVNLPLLAPNYGDEQLSNETEAAIKKPRLE